MTTDLTVIVVSYNTRDILQQCLRCLKCLDSPLEIQVIIVDNASSDGSAEMVQTEFADYLLICNCANVGFACANNQGIKVARGDFILLLNSDAFLTSTALHALVDYAARDSNIGVCGPQLIHANGRWQRSYGLVPSRRSVILDSLGVTSIKYALFRYFWKFTGSHWRPKPVGYVKGACMLIRKDMILEIGALDESFFFYVEDAEFCDRARQRGWKVLYVPQSRVVHLHGQSSSRKSIVRSQQLMRDSLEKFIVARYGLGEWSAYLNWMRRGFWWRYHLCTLVSKFGLVTAERCSEYVDAYSVCR